MKNFFKRIKNEWNTIRPHKHWMMLLHISAIIVVCMIIGSLYLLYQVKNARVPKVIDSTLGKHDSIKGDLLNTMTESFSQKADTFQKLQSHPLKYKDPSL